MSKEKNRLIIVGAGGFGRVVSELARLEYDCVFVDDGFETGVRVCDIPVVGKVPDLKELRTVCDKLIVAIGNNNLREQIYANAEKWEYIFPNLIHTSAYVSNYSQIGKGCVFLQNTVVQNGASVGNGVLLNPGVEIHHDSNVDDFSLIYTNSVIRTYAHIGKRVRVGSNVTIGNDVVIADDMDIQNGEMLFSNMGRK